MKQYKRMSHILKSINKKVSPVYHVKTKKEMEKTDVRNDRVATLQNVGK